MIFTVISLVVGSTGALRAIGPSRAAAGALPAVGHSRAAASRCCSAPADAAAGAAADAAELNEPVSRALPRDRELFFGDYGMISRERKSRAYASKRGFERIAQGRGAPIARDLLPPSPKPGDERWLSGGFRLAVVVAATAGYVPLLAVLSPLAETARASGVAPLVTSFSPGVSILFGTLLSLTVSIQYQRLAKIQDLAAAEAADITLLTRLCLGLFGSDDDAATRGRIAAALGEQVSTLVQASRQEELLSVMAADPYGAIGDELDEAARAGPLRGDVRLERGSALVQSLVQARASRLSTEALSLPQTHFAILGTLGSLLLLGYALTGAAQPMAAGGPPLESAVLFGILTGTYVLAFNFALDLNRPFDGVYQVRRSAAASGLLSARLLLDAHLPSGLGFERPAQRSESSGE